MAGVAQFRKSLASFDSWLKEKCPSASSSLRRPASDRDLERLSKEAFGGKSVPPPIKAWFQWQNGQKIDGDPILPDYKGSSFYLCSIADVIRTRRTMRALAKTGDLHGPWSDSWIPLLDGTFGDSLVFEPTGRGEGKIRAWWHETKGREVVSASLESLIARCRRELTRADKQAAKEAVASPQGLPAKWVKGSDRVLEGHPLAADLKSDPVGAAYLVGPFDLPLFAGSKAHLVAVKVDADSWLRVYERSRDGALAEMRNCIEKGRTSEWAISVESLASELKAENTIWRRKVRQRLVEFA